MVADAPISKQLIRIQQTCFYCRFHQGNELKASLKIIRFHTYYTESCSETLLFAFHELSFANPIVYWSSTSLCINLYIINICISKN